MCCHSLPTPSLQLLWSQVISITVFIYLKIKCSLDLWWSSAALLKMRGPQKIRKKMESKHAETVMAIWRRLTSLLCLTKIPNRLKKEKNWYFTIESLRSTVLVGMDVNEFIILNWEQVSFNMYCLPVSEKTVWGFFGTVLSSSTDYMLIRKIEVFVKYRIRR